MIISYTTDKRQQKVTNSFVSCISRQAYTIKKIDHGVLVNYKFPSEGFYIPVRYILNDRGLNASILFSDIKENKDNKLDTISFLPYLGAGDMNDEGFMLVPDGSGAIIYMNNGKPTAMIIASRFTEEIIHCISQERQVMNKDLPWLCLAL